MGRFPAQQYSFFTLAAKPKVSTSIDPVMTGGERPPETKRTG
jgi:hypothetical protein